MKFIFAQIIDGNSKGKPYLEIPGLGFIQGKRATGANEPFIEFKLTIEQLIKLSLEINKELIIKN